MNALFEATSVLKTRPNDPDAWVRMGRALAARGVRDEPAACYRQALFYEPRHNDALIALGLSALRVGDLNEAEDCFQQVLRRTPGNAEAIGGAAMALERRGSLVEAWTLITSTRDNVPVLAMAAASLGPRVGQTRQALRLVEDSLKHHGHVVPLLYARADLLDHMGQYRRAFEAYERANGARDLPFDPQQHLHGIQQLIAAFPTFDGLSTSAETSKRPVFIVGMPRSGTTLVEQILSRHPTVQAQGELETLRDIAHAIGGYPLPELSASALNDGAATYLGALGTRGTRATDKMPNNVLHLGLAARLTPGAQVVYVTRDAADAGMSCFRQPFGDGLPWATSIPGIAAWQEGVRALMSHWKRVLPLPIHEISYEALAAEPEGTTRRLLTALNLPFHRDCLTPQDSSRVIATQSYAAVQSPIHVNAVGRSRPYHPWIAPLVLLRHPA